MTTVIEKDFIELQTKTTHALVEQKVIVSEQEIVNNFLDKINQTKKEHALLIKQYDDVIETTVEYLSDERTPAELFLLTESISNLINTTKRLILSFENEVFKGAYLAEVKQYKTLVDDINEIRSDIEIRLNKENKLSDILNEF